MQEFVIATSANLGGKEYFAAGGTNDSIFICSFKWSKFEMKSWIKS